MNPTEKELEEEAKKAEDDLLNDTSISESAKRDIREFRKNCKESPKIVDELLEYVKKGKK